MLLSGKRERKGGMGRETGRTGYWLRRVLPLVLSGVLLAGYAWLLLTYFVPVTGGVDQNGYHVSARMFNLDGAFCRRTADDLQHVGHMWVVNGRGNFYPKYPPFYPLLAAGMNRLLGPGGGFYATVWGAILAVAGMYLVARFWMGRFYALAAALLLALSPAVFGLALAKNSHTPSLAFFLWGMAAFLFAAHRKCSYRKLPFAFLGGMLVGYTVGIRYTDLLLILVPLAYAGFLAPKRWRWKLLAATALGAAVPYAALAAFHWQAYGAPWRSGYSLTSESSAFSWRFLWQNLQIYVPEFFTLMIGPAGIIALLAWRVRRRQALFWGLWLLPTFVLYLMYYWAPDGESVGALRFLTPLLPAVILLALLSLRRLVRAVHRGVPLLLTVGLLLAVQGFWAWTWITRLGEQRFASDLQKAVLVETLRQHVPAGAVIIADIDLLNELDFEQRWLLYPGAILNPAEIQKIVERSLGAQAAGLQKARAETLQKTLGSFKHNELYAWLRNFFEKKRQEGRPVYFFGRSWEANRFRRAFYRQFEVEELGMVTGARPAWLLRDIKPNASRYRPRSEPVPLTVYELVRLDERRAKELPPDAGLSLLSAERGDILSRINPENDQELLRDLNRLESIRDDTLGLRRAVSDAKTREEIRDLRRERDRLKADSAKLRKEIEAQKKPQSAPPKK